MAETFANNATGVLNATITSGAASLVLNSGQGAAFPATGNFRILIESEIILVGARSGDTLSSLSRGQEGTAAAGHNSGIVVTHILTASALQLFAQPPIPRTDLATVTRKVVPVVMSANSAPWVDGSSVVLTVELPIPDDYVSGDLAWKWLIRSNVTGNQFRLDRAAFRARDTVALLTIESGVQSNFSISGTAGVSQMYSHTITAANFQAGDVILVNLARLGADANDTNTGIGSFDGVWVEYTGRA